RRATRIPRPEPRANPPTASLNVYRPLCQRSALLSQNECAMSLGFGRRNVWTWNAVVSPCQRARTATKTTIAGSQSRRRPPSPLESPDGTGSTMVLRSVPLSRCDACRRRVASRESLAHRGDELEETSVLARGHAARAGQVDRDDLGDATGARRHDDDSRR